MLGGGDTRVNVTYNMIKILPLSPLDLRKRTGKSVRRRKHDRMLFSNGQRGAGNVSGRLRSSGPARERQRSERLLCCRERSETKSSFGTESWGSESASVSGDGLS